MAIKKIKITIGESLEDFFKESRKHFLEIDKGIRKPWPHKINFENMNTYKKMLTEKRLSLLKLIAAKKPKSIKELSIFSNRDFKNVYEDVKMLKNIGLIKLKKTKTGFVPIALYDEVDIHIKIPLEALSN